MWATAAVAAALCATAASASPQAVVPCTYANGLQSGPGFRRIPGGLVISLRVENTRGRSNCRFRAKVTIALLADETRLLLPVRGNPAPLWAVDRTVPKGTALDVSWLWRNWCRHRLTAVGSLASTATAVPQEWVGLFRSPGCRDRGRPSTVAAYRLEIVR
jgi:hypothetical protein